MVLASDGKKMSKSLKNYTDPTQVMDKFGADARLAAALLVAVVVASLPVRQAILALSGRRIRAGNEVAAWSVDRARLRWLEIDGHPVLPATPGEAMRRLEGSAGDFERALTANYRLWSGDLVGASTALAGWQPVSQAMIARKALQVAELAPIIGAPAADTSLCRQCARVTKTGGNSLHIGRRSRHVALQRGVGTPRDDGTVQEQGQAVGPTRGDGHDVRGRSWHVGLPEGVIAPRGDGAI